MWRTCLVLALAGVLAAEEAARLYQQARRAERQGRTLEAFQLYTRAAGLKPTDPRYRRGIERLQALAAPVLAAAAAKAVPPEPKGTVIEFAGENPGEEADAPPTAAELREAEQPAGPPEVRPRDGPRSFDLQGNARDLYPAVAAAYGIQAVFDPDLSAGQRVRFRMEGVRFREAIRALMTLTSTFVTPLNSTSLLVASDTQQKRNELEPVVAALLPIPQVISVEEANEVGRAVQQALDIKRLSVDANRRQVYVRDHVTRVRLAEALYRDLTRRRGEVLLELELVSVNSSKVTNLGATLPTSFPAFYFGTFGNSQPPTNTGPLVGIGGGDTLFGIRIGDAAFQANWNRSQGRLLSRFEVRATDGLPASLHIGDRYPIVNAIFSPIVVTDQIQNLQNSGQYRQPFPSFTFEDLGLVLKVTPRVHDRREVSLTIEAEFRVLAGTSLNGLPVISSRKFSSAVRLREGESSLVSGLAVLQNVHTRSGLGPLAEIPLLGHLLGSHQWQADQSELLVSITPHLTVAPPGEQGPSRSFHYGAELRPVPSL